MYRVCTRVGKYIQNFRMYFCTAHLCMPSEVQHIHLYLPEQQSHHLVLHLVLLDTCVRSPLFINIKHGFRFNARRSVILKQDVVFRFNKQFLSSSFFRFLEDTSPLRGVSFWTSGDVCPGFKRQGRSLTSTLYNLCV